MTAAVWALVASTQREDEIASTARIHLPPHWRRKKDGKKLIYIEWNSYSKMISPSSPAGKAVFHPYSADHEVKQ